MGAITGHRRRLDSFNIFIGNATDINSIADLSARIAVGNIIKFKKLGNDVYAKVDGNYEFVANTNIGSPWTTYQDKDGLLFNISINGFRSMPNLVGDLTFTGVINQTGANPFRFTQNSALGNLYLPNCINITATSFLRECTFKEFHAVNCITLDAAIPFFRATSLSLVNLPNCINIGSDPTIYEEIFSEITIGCTINVPLIHATSNNGSIDADLQYAINTRGCTVNFI